MMLKFAIPFLLGLAFFAGLEAWAGPKRDFSMPMWLALLTIPAALGVYAGGAMIFGPLAFLTVNAAFGELSDATKDIVALICFVAGLWLAALALQLVQNAVRLLQSRALEPIRWIKNPFEKRTGG